MQKNILICLLSILVSCISYAEDSTNQLTSITSPTSFGTMCLIPGIPQNLDYKIIKNIKTAKHSYGSVTEVIPHLVTKAKDLNGDAIIEFSAAQRFGFWPWQFVRPTARGTVIKLTDSKNIDCKSLGGALY